MGDARLGTDALPIDDERRRGNQMIVRGQLVIGIIVDIALDDDDAGMI